MYLEPSNGPMGRLHGEFYKQGVASHLLITAQQSITLLHSHLVSCQRELPPRAAAQLRPATDNVYVHFYQPHAVAIASPNPDRIIPRYDRTRKPLTHDVGCLSSSMSSKLLRRIAA
jgi:hypothetical protein